MIQTISEKIKTLKEKFHKAKTTEEKYLLIMEMGKNLPPLNEKFKTAEYLIDGCQSTTYLHSYLDNGLVCFEAESDALISSGLVALLIYIYSNEKAETILRNPPVFLKELGIESTISPSRANGLSAMYERLIKDVLKFLK